MWYLIVSFLFLLGGYILGNKYPWKDEVKKVEEDIKKVKL